MTRTNSRREITDASRPMARRVATVPRMVSNRVRSATSPAITQVGGCEPPLWTTVLRRLQALAKRDAAGRPQLESNSTSAAITGLTSEPLTYRNATCAAALP